MLKTKKSETSRYFIPTDNTHWKEIIKVIIFKKSSQHTPAIVYWFGCPYFGYNWRLEQILIGVQKNKWKEITESEAALNL